MTSGCKAFFFDIDGTLCDFENKIPNSAKEAIRTLRRNGHTAFLCSGRSRAYIQNPELLDIGFDGVISGCGTMIEYNGEIISNRQIDPELAELTVRTVRRYGFRPILEGTEYLYMDYEDFGHDRYGKKLIAELGERMLSISGNWGKWEISKLSCATDNIDTAACFAELEKYYDYIVHNPAVVEIVPKGYHKGTGILKVCELLGIDTADTYAFGDSVNDLEMFRAVGTSIAMGNGTVEAKAAADYVTASVHEDGIWKACEHFGFIQAAYFKA